MARDPPSSAASSSELRDLSLTPSHIRQGKITIIHPQLRDLILPLKRGHVLYPRGSTLEEQTWEAEEDETEGESGGPIKPSVSAGTTRTFANLSFTPNCLTARGNIMACGGQHGELYLTHLSSPTHTPLQSRFTSSPPVRPFSLSVTLPTRSINNSLTILPCWPEEWKKRERDRRLSYLRGRRDRDDEWKEQVDPERSDSESEGEDEDGAEEGMDVDMESEDDELEDMPSPSSTASFATYPNTVPFVHAPRIPHLSPPQSTSQLPGRRSTSFGSHGHRRNSQAQPQQTSHRGSFSSGMDRSHIQYVTSIPHHRPPEFAVAGSSIASSSGSVKRKRKAKRLEEPRLLISNNDQTVKMFSIRRSPSSPSSSTRPLSPSDRAAEAGPDQTDRVRQLQRELQSARDTQADVRRLYERVVANRATVPAPPPRFGSSFGWDGIAANEGLQAGEEALRHELDRAREHLRVQQENFQREREDFERVIGMRVGGINLGEQSGGSHLGPSEEREVRRLARVGGTRFNYAINHSSLSPDLKQMVSVGDSPEGDVYLFEVIDGGREFRKIGVYNAATDSSFSTSWSKDGRKFAVASQDGQVTVWDHRSSRPLAVFYTTPAITAPSFSSDLASSRLEQGWTSPRFANPNVVLVDPASGDVQTGSSTSGREAARVVKFSPEGSSRDLMVFTEENSHFHIVDAKTFNAHVVVPVPYTVSGSSTDPAAQYRDRMGVEGGTWGIAGVGFDPTGDWLYSGTEKTVVEWDLRRFGGGGEGGTWGMA